MTRRFNRYGRKRRVHRANFEPITQEYLNFRCQGSLKFLGEKQKWVLFCEHLLATNKLHMVLYEPENTLSKYIYICDNKDGTDFFKVRFSDHMPTIDKELNNDSDLYVGRTNTNGSINWAEAVNLTKIHFKI